MKSSRFLIAICLAAIPATSCGSVEADAEGGVDSETLTDVAVVDTANDDTQDASLETTAIDSADAGGDTCELDYDVGDTCAWHWSWTAKQAILPPNRASGVDLAGTDGAGLLLEDVLKEPCVSAPESISSPSGDVILVGLIACDDVEVLFDPTTRRARGMWL